MLKLLTSSQEGYATFTDTDLTVALDLEISEGADGRRPGQRINKSNSKYAQRKRFCSHR